MNQSLRAGTRDSFLAKGSFLFCLGIAAVVVAVYLWFGQRVNGEFGFPLDDAWIHQVYARNLGTRFEFSFFAGQPSAGSTSPLWAILLGLGYAVRVDYRWWTIGLGVVLLAASGWMAGRVVRRLLPDVPLVASLAPFFLVLEWHMVWAAASGMEILLFVFLALALVERVYAFTDTSVAGRGGRYKAHWF